MFQLQHKRSIANVLGSFITTLVISGCATSNDLKDDANAVQQEGQSPKPAYNTNTISMDYSEEPGKSFTFYGIEIGESRNELGEKYSKTGCWKDFFFERCAVPLVLNGAAGILPGEKALLIAAYKSGHAYRISAAITGEGWKYSLRRLEELYGPPTLSDEKRYIWKGVGDHAVILGKPDPRRNQPAYVKFTADLPAEQELWAYTH